VLSGFINALKLTGRTVEDTKVVINGAGAAAIATTRMLHKYGVPKKNIVMCDLHGVISKGRRWMNKFKDEFATDR
jgi:malic enzyme